MIAITGQQARYEVIIDTAGNVKAKGDGECTEANDYKAACSILFGGAQRSSDPARFITSVVEAIRAKLELEDEVMEGDPE